MGKNSEDFFGFKGNSSETKLICTFEAEKSHIPELTDRWFSSMVFEQNHL